MVFIWFIVCTSNLFDNRLFWIKIKTSYISLFVKSNISSNRHVDGKQFRSTYCEAVQKYGAWARSNPSRRSLLPFYCLKSSLNIVQRFTTPTVNYQLNTTNEIKLLPFWTLLSPQKQYKDLQHLQVIANELWQARRKETMRAAWMINKMSSKKQKSHDRQIILPSPLHLFPH
jgi:hypothetical protein